MKTICLLLLFFGFSSFSFSKNEYGQSDSTLRHLEKETGLSRKLLKKLIQWNAIPDWVQQSAILENNWAETLHRNVTNDSSWPEYLKNLNVKNETCVKGSNYIAKSDSSTIRISNITLVYLRELIEIINYPFVLPNSSDPNAKMLMDTSRIADAVKRLGRFQGMINEVDYFEGPKVLWGAAEIFGSRFMYYHELGHVKQHYETDTLKINILPEEEKLKYEIDADQFALSMLILELRHQDIDMQVEALIGITNAMFLLAASEYAEPYKKSGYKSIKGAMYRISRLFYYSNISVQNGNLKQEAVKASIYYWDLMKLYFEKIDYTPHPVFNLLYQTADRPKEDWVVFRNQVVKWCIFGDRDKAISNLKDVYQAALTQSQTQPRAKKVLKVYEYLFYQTKGLDWKINLKKSITE